MNTEVSSRPLSNMEVWRRYCLVQAHLMGYLARQLTRATGLSEADFQVLDALLDAPGQRARARELRWTLQWEKSRLSHQLRRMVARGLIDRQACAEDARGANVVLTDAGREAARRARQVREESLRAIVFDTLGPEHMVHLHEVTTLLADRLARAAQEDPDCLAAYREAFEADEGA
ncbi:helix-turn-helix domain-containing protein [Sphaerobacter sp.]|uniref:MarR family winged helix-turn-helix transcriptional regulator n=1 Tax=Sphaerobacter sp. TaxID=2099654 RepID=UPI001DF17445|nr:helix-turn-helix domain-containing protein [Sphaerobacter sp.]MBX5446782.1 MarR family transcriptional regulator [Sphaerobacter sp.]